MLGGTELIGRYFEQSPEYSTLDALYVFPWLTIAENETGIDNNPCKRAIEYGFEIVGVVEQAPVNQGIQQAPFRIYLLKEENRFTPSPCSLL